MTKEEFQKMYEKFDPKASGYYKYDEEEVKKQLEQFKAYSNIINSGNYNYKIWVKHPSNNKYKGWFGLKDDSSIETYLPDFIETKSLVFGRTGNRSNHYMMYRVVNGDDEGKKDKIYIRNFKAAEVEGKSDKKNEEEYVGDDDKKINDVFAKIRNILENAFAFGGNDKGVKELENNKYEGFSATNTIRKIAVMAYLQDVCFNTEAGNANAETEGAGNGWKIDYLAIYDEKKLEKLYDILSDIDGADAGKWPDGGNYFERNANVCKIAWQLLDDKLRTDNNKSKEEIFYKFNSFLWHLVDDVDSMFIDFNNPNLIFNGAPGTGKTYTVTETIKRLQNIDSDKYKSHEMVQFHPSYTYQDFIEGIKPLGMSDGNIKLGVVNGRFKDFCIKVRKENEVYYETKYKGKYDEDKNYMNFIGDPNNFKDWPHYYFTVDEINRGNLSNIFGEAFSLLEPGYRDYDFRVKSGGYTDVKHLLKTPLSNVIEKLSDKERGDLLYKFIGDQVYFGIPFNIHFIGMMNDVDKSIDSFDLAFRRRFKWIQMRCDYEALEILLENKGFGDGIDDYIENCKGLNYYITGADPKTKGSTSLNLGSLYEIGHSIFMKIASVNKSTKITKGKKEIVFDSYIEGMLKEYIRQVVEDNEIDGKMKEARKIFLGEL